MDYTKMTVAKHIVEPLLSTSLHSHPDSHRCPVTGIDREAHLVAAKILKEVVQQALDAAKLGRTAIIVAHRISSVQNCDRILYIDHGMVAESGTHSELMELNGKYAKLVRAQDLNACS
ncbi:hypothetical protein GCK32_005068 [Trichostrongylus colubriformis]|uniref:Uncharacterized protein n=1 Tax=Trichostrongylus colubriformis TaxID=6319 RepID=A0AAN8IFV1_TRICO